jgi:hypothetical protein
MDLDVYRRNRRAFLHESGLSVGRLALASLMASALPDSSAAAPRPRGKPLVARPPHFAPRAKRVIHLFMAGAPSQLDLFDYKPELTRLEGKPLPPEVIGGQRYAFIRPDAAVLGPRYKFARYGQCGAELSEVLPHLAEVVDDVCLIRSMRTDQFNHAPAQIFFNTGFPQPGRPSLGSWVVYGLGADSEELPAYVVMSTGKGISGGAANWSSGFLPTVYAGVRLRNTGDPILNLSTPEGLDARAQQDSLKLIEQLNRRHLREQGDPEIETRIAAYELAFRLQSSAPELMDLRSESRQTLTLYGADPEKPSFARACLLARRMIERGVRFINIYHEGWDAHSDVAGNLKQNCGATDQASAALVLDLKRRGLLEDTLVIWGGEFGRTPMVENNAGLGRSLGRDHHPQAYTLWLAGGGVKAGLTHGRTDDLGFHVAEHLVHVRDLQATILHLLGFDHERLSVPVQGLDFRLTGVEPCRVVREILA